MRLMLTTLAAILLLCNAARADAPELDFVDPTDQAYKFLGSLLQAGYLPDYPSNYLEDHPVLTRYEFAQATICCLDNFIHQDDSNAEILAESLRANFNTELINWTGLSSLYGPVAPLSETEMPDKRPEIGARRADQLFPSDHWANQAIGILADNCRANTRTKLKDKMLLQPWTYSETAAAVIDLANNLSADSDPALIPLVDSLVCLLQPDIRYLLSVRADKNLYYTDWAIRHSVSLEECRKHDPYFDLPPEPVWMLSQEIPVDSFLYPLLDYAQNAGFLPNFVPGYWQNRNGSQTFEELFLANDILKLTIHEDGSAIDRLVSNVLVEAQRNLESSENFDDRSNVCFIGDMRKYRNSGITDLWDSWPGEALLKLQERGYLTNLPVSSYHSVTGKTRLEMSIVVGKLLSELNADSPLDIKILGETLRREYSDLLPDWAPLSEQD
ncbi:MAG: hypothetical protein H7A35_14800 [Planctomycetales bacterium]|nr:hypothetical protein [bacterium]UNM08100.1 MAG: hypothetical protein H7A35_14800 [Planctomycetales bacterium]